MSIIPNNDIEPTPEEDEAWNLFLRKFENLQLPPIPHTDNDIEENVIYGVFGKSVRSL